MREFLKLMRENLHNLAVIQPTSSNTEPNELPIMNLMDVMGSSVQIEKRLSSILTLLEMEGEEARFRLNIQAYKA
jgi:hypothetical protein